MGKRVSYGFGVDLSLFRDIRIELRSGVHDFVMQLHTMLTIQQLATRLRVSSGAKRL
jgi:hypothetical protein